VPFYFLTYAPADLWWLYHVIAAIFIKFYDIIWGVKFALRNILGAETAVIPNKPDSWLYKVFDNLKSDFEKVYENKELVIFRIKP